MCTDPIADFLTSIRNALRMKHPAVRVPYSKIKEGIADILHKEGYITSYKVHKTPAPQGELELGLKYFSQKKTPVIQHIQRVSKPGLRVFYKANEIPPVINNYGINIMTTSHGLMTGKAAKKYHTGGEILCTVY